MFLAKSKNNGGIYMLTQSKYESESKDWEKVEVEVEVVELSYKEIKEALDEKNIEYKGNASKKELESLLEE